MDIAQALLDYLGAYVEFDIANREPQITAAKERFHKQKNTIIEYVTRLQRIEEDYEQLKARIEDDRHESNLW